MSDYYKINGNSLNTLCKYILDSNITGTTNTVSYYYRGITTSTYNSNFTSSINEKLNATNYKVNNNDINTFCIATWVESNGSTGFTSIPSWCNKIRAVLIGGGGGGQYGNAGTFFTQQQTAQQQQNTHNSDPIRRHDYLSGLTHQVHTHTQTVSSKQQQNVQRDEVIDHQQINQGYQAKYAVSRQETDAVTVIHQQATSTPYVDGYNTGTAGTSGGGGGFIYISDYDISNYRNSISVTLGDSGSSGTALVDSSEGTATILNIGTYSFKALGGNAGTTTAGTGGQTQVSQTTGVSTSSGSGRNPGGYQTYYSQTQYGFGGSNGIAGTSTKTNGYPGNTGYYRIYFLAN
jgi:hypothetical protein